MPITATDRIRVEHAIAAMYRMPWARPRLLIEQAAEEVGCGRRQLERAFEAFETGAAQELRAIRCELAAACLVERSWDEKSERVIARRVGLTDDCALRRVIGARWDISPGQIREAAKLQCHLVSWQRLSSRRAERWGSDFAEDAYCERLHRMIREVLKEAPIEIRRLVEGEVVWPLPRHAAQRPESLARERVGRRKEAVIHEAELAA
jgi:AraC-like DNA-binding protein